ncbi:isochorismate synthase [Rubrobacter radiotolerans]|uniref:Isochorismate synthase MenF n=1 Tax=Rubrobacter radiotolerans TaxID=42256 RepID=A0A023X6D1_RUBRA|nr:isochorismate synthase [Rubrobacter radiotolerans]
MIGHGHTASEGFSASSEAAGPVRPVRELAGLVRELLLRPESRGGERRAVRLAVEFSAGAGEVPSLETPLGWLFSLKNRTEAQLFPKVYWSGREAARRGGRESAAVGAAHRADGLQATLLAAADSPETRYYGGLRFDSGYPEERRDARWSGFGDGSFVLPRVELSRDDGLCVLSCNLVLPDDAKYAESLPAFVEGLMAEDPAGPDGAAPRLVARRDRPDFEGWSREVERAVEEFRERPGKVVFARRADLDFDGDLDALSLLGSLKAATPGCFHFYFEPEPGGAAFIGATPERLYGREGRAVRSEAVAGTRPRGASAADDDGLLEELLGSEKDRAEQRYVRDSIERDLRKLCAALTVEEGVSEMKLASRRHLVSRFRGTLAEGVTDADVIRALHPTPAVGGYPKGEAILRLRDSEPFDRGWYAGPVGWLSRDAAELAVGIRSGLVGGSRLSLFSGAGIVAGSTPGGEWAEIEQKISDFILVLGDGESSGAAPAVALPHDAPDSLERATG